MATREHMYMSLLCDWCVTGVFVCVLGCVFVQLSELLTYLVILYNSEGLFLTILAIWLESKPS